MKSFISHIRFIKNRGEINVRLLPARLFLSFSESLFLRKGYLRTLIGVQSKSRFSFLNFTFSLIKFFAKKFDA
jgi:hypothetical protein